MPFCGSGGGLEERRIRVRAPFDLRHQLAAEARVGAVQTRIEQALVLDGGDRALPDVDVVDDRADGRGGAREIDLVVVQIERSQGIAGRRLHLAAQAVGIDDAGAQRDGGARRAHLDDATLCRRAALTVSSASPVTAPARISRSSISSASVSMRPICQNTPE